MTVRRSLFDPRLLVGLALTLPAALSAQERTAPEPAREVDSRLDCPWLEQIEDDLPVLGPKQNLDEYNAYNYFVQHARKQPLEALAKHARRELTFRNLFADGRAIYRGQIVHISGRLRQVSWIGPTAQLQAEGVKDLYEAWVYTQEGRFDYPVCVVFAELPEGLKLGDEYDQEIAFDGYYFKRYRYESRNKDPKEKYRLAPLVVARAPAKLLPPMPPGAVADEVHLLGTRMMPIALGLLIAMLVLVVTLGWWFRRGDRRIAVAVRDKTENPFADLPPSRSYEPGNN